MSRNHARLLLAGFLWVTGCAQAEQICVNSPKDASLTKPRLDLHRPSCALPLPGTRCSSDNGVGGPACAANSRVNRSAQERPTVRSEGQTSAEIRLASGVSNPNYESDHSPGEDASTNHGQQIGIVQPATPVPEIATPGGEEMSVGLTLSAIEELAAANNPSLAQAREIENQASSNWLQVGLYPNPVVGYTASEIGQDGRAGQQGAFISQTIVRGNKLELNRAVASWNVERARWQQETQRIRVLNDVRSRFYEALGAQRMVEIAEELREVAHAGVSSAQQLFEAQQVAKSDVLQAEIQLNEVDILVQNARYRQQAARQRLANVVGVPELSRDPLLGELEEPLQPIDATTLWEKIAAASPELETARAQVRRAQTRLRREQVEPIPDLMTQFSVQHDAATSFTLANAQVGVMLPAYNDNRGNISAAAAQMRQAAANLHRIELLIRDRFAETYRRYNMARNQVERYRDGILPKAERNLELATAAYRVGEYDFLRVLTARQTLFSNRVEYVSSLIEFRQARIELDGLLLTGGLSDPTGEPIDADVRGM